MSSQGSGLSPVLASRPADLAPPLSPGGRPQAEESSPAAPASIQNGLPHGNRPNFEPVFEPGAWQARTVHGITSMQIMFPSRLGP